MSFLQRYVAVLALAQVIQSTQGSMDDGLKMLRSTARRLHRILNLNTVDTTESYYSEEAQAWRMLGLYMDCETQDDGSSLCQRYLLWAAYVDEDYTGNGHGEYMFQNENGKWDKSACEIAGSERCVKMDCHLPNTHFKVLGYYKQPYVTDFFEQLFQHQGSCTWSDASYNFMENNREFWPEECTESVVTDENGSAVYYDIKPLPEGKMVIGLYSDAACSKTYTGSLTVEEAVQANDNNNGDDDGNGNNDANAGYPAVGSDEWFDEWNNALSTYKTCQPCKVSSLSNMAKGRRLEDQQDQADQEDQQEDAQNEDGGQNDDGGMFGCQDAAGYQGANQCAMFALNTDIRLASFRDVRLATLQGNIVPAYGAGVTSSSAQKWRRSWGFFTFSTIVFLIGLFMFCCCVKVKRRTSSAKEPLLDKRSARSGSKK